MHSSAALNRLYKLISRPVQPGEPAELLAGKLLELVERQRTAMGPRELSNSLCSMAKLRLDNDAVIAALVQEAWPKLSKFNPRDLANTIWALATLEYYDAAFTESLIFEASPRLTSFNLQDLAGTIQALAKQGHYDQIFVSALANEVRPYSPNFNSQSVVKTIWALAVLQHYDEAFTISLLHEAAEVRCDLAPKNLVLLFESLLILKARGLLTSDNVLESAYPQLWEKCRHAWLDLVRMPRSTRSSRQVQLRVLALVRELPGCYGAVSGQLTEDGLFSVEVALPLPARGAQFAIQINGPAHFRRDGSLTTSNEMRNLLLEARGWTVINIPRVKWEGLEQKGKDACLEFLTEVIFDRVGTGGK